MRAARSSQHLARRALALGYTGAAETHRLRTDRAWRDEIKRASRAKGPVVVGPWISEVGFEVLYWLPLLNRILEDSAVRPADVTIVTRGGAHCWYRDVGHNQLELFDLFSPDELRQFNERRVRETGGQKQMGRTSLDIEVVRRAGDRLPIEAALIHPSLMYNAFRSLWSWRVPPKAVLADMRFRTLPDPGRPDIAARLPDEYVAVKAYHSSCFPPTPENRAFVAALLERLSARTNVVLLSTGLRVDDHDEVEVGGGEVIDAQGWMTPRDNLEVQTQIIRGTSCLFSSYGGFSYLGPFLGVPSVCFWSRANFNSTHFELMRQAVHALGAPPFVALDTADVELLEAALVAPADVAARR